MDLREMPGGTFLRHPWELARAEFFMRQLVAAGATRDKTRILDVGAGDAWFTQRLLGLNADAHATCWDVGYEHHTPEPHERIEYRATKPTGRFDWILLMDVVEHVADDRAFLREVQSLAAPHARVLFSVPAWPKLYTNHDEALRHYRRYTPSQAKRLLAESGLRIHHGGGLFWSLLLPRYVSALREGRTADETLTGRHLPKPDLSWRHGLFSQRLSVNALRIDQWVSEFAAKAGVELPGLSFFALCSWSEL